MIRKILDCISLSVQILMVSESSTLNWTNSMRIDIVNLRK